MPAPIDVAVVGGGPAGLAAAIACAQSGLSVTVLERGPFPADKACGEGLLPPALRALEGLGVRELLPAVGCAPFAGLRYIEADGTTAEAQLPDGGGLGVRRLALVGALEQRARGLGVVLQANRAVRGHRLCGSEMILALDDGELRAKLLVAADGLASPRRRDAGLDRPLDPWRWARPRPVRFGIRRHFQRPAVRPMVEIHLAAGAEAYLTPAGPNRLGVAFLWEEGALQPRASYQALLEKFPAVAALVAGVAADSEVRGAGPLQRPVRARAADRLVLIGDAAGYLDAITGEGLSLALAAAVTLGEVAPDAIRRGAGRAALAPYERAYDRRFARYLAVTSGMLFLARHPGLRRWAIGRLARRPQLFAKLVALGLPR